MKNTGFIAGLILGAVITRILLNQYVQDRKVFMAKEKHLLKQLEKYRKENDRSIQTPAA